MSDIFDFLNRRLVETEMLAEAAQTSTVGEEWYVGGSHHRADGVALKFDRSGSSKASVIADLHRKREQIAFYLAAFDPAHVLVHCSVTRELLKLHAPTGYNACSSCLENLYAYESAEPVDYPCDTIRTLASAYSSHPDYNPEWKVS